MPLYVCLFFFHYFRLPFTDGRGPAGRYGCCTSSLDCSPLTVGLSFRIVRRSVPCRAVPLLSPLPLLVCKFVYLTGACGHIDQLLAPPLPPAYSYSAYLRGPLLFSLLLLLLLLAAPQTDCTRDFETYELVRQEPHVGPAVLQDWKQCYPHQQTARVR